MSNKITEKQKSELLNDAVTTIATSHFNEYRKTLAEVSQVLDIVRCTIFNVIDIISYKGSLDKESRDLSKLKELADGIGLELSEVVKSINIKLGEQDGKKTE